MEARAHACPAHAAGLHGCLLRPRRGASRRLPACAGRWPARARTCCWPLPPPPPSPECSAPSMCVLPWRSAAGGGMAPPPPHPHPCSRTPRTCSSSGSCRAACGATATAAPPAALPRMAPAGIARRAAGGGTAHSGGRELLAARADARACNQEHKNATHHLPTTGDLSASPAAPTRTRARATDASAPSRVLHAHARRLRPAGARHTRSDAAHGVHW